MKLATPQRLLRFPGFAVLWVVLFCSNSLPLALARDSAPPYSAQKSTQALSSIGQLTLKPTDVPAELAADTALGRMSPLRFAVPQDVSVTPATQGTWEAVEGGRLWRLRVVSTGATDLNFGFSSFWLPEGATLHISAESEDYFQGPYTAQDNADHGQLWTALVPGDAAVIEVFVPTGAQPEPQLILSRVGTGYRDWFGRKGGPGLAKSGACNIDVVCPQTVGWENEIRSVGVYTLNGIFECTGTLIGNARNDFRNFFLTANHCTVTSANAATVVVYWNFQSKNCGDHSGGSLAQNQSGTVFRASKTDVDFCLLELSSIPSPSFHVYYSGWDRSGAIPPGVAAIHHPNADEKAFSESTNPILSGNSCIGTGVGTHWLVVWTMGTTEPGSSGSGLWNLSTKRLVGTLSGGAGACDNPSGQDCYGKFAVAWNSGTSASQRLSDWLDPLNTGVISLPGIDPSPASLPIGTGSALVTESCNPPNGAVDPGEPVTLSFSVRNMGALTSTNMIGTLVPGNGIGTAGPAQSYGAVATGATVSRAFSLIVTSACGSAISPALHLQDGLLDLGTLTNYLQVGVASNYVVFSENFDAVSAPKLPAGWTPVIAGAGSPWATLSGTKDTAPNSVFAPDASTISDNNLRSPTLVLSPGDAQISFRHWYSTESGYDGGVLEISINGGAFTDIVALGGSFVQNGYNGKVPTGYQSPIAGRNAWTGDSLGFINTVANLPPSSSSRTVQFQWRLGCDESNPSSQLGWYVDTVKLAAVTPICCSYAPPLVNPRLASPSTMAFSFDTAGGKNYVIESATNLPPLWVPSQTNAGTGLRQSVTNAVNTSPSRFFRIKVP